MHKIPPNDIFFLSPTVRDRGFAIAAFDFAPDMRGDGKMPTLPADYLTRALPHGRKA